MISVLSLLALATWGVVLALPSRPWSTREQLHPVTGPADLSQVTVLIPARDEADVIGGTLRALGEQGSGLRVIVVDDRSDDGTGRQARSMVPPAVDLVVVDGAPRPAGWAGKLWALEQGLVHLTTPRVLLLDADIALAPGVLTALLEKMQADQLAMVSIMARLPTGGFWERLLVPAYVLFFKLLYPFSRVNQAESPVAAAAGGCVLLETAVLSRLGGFAVISGELIDDCALAARVKAAGHRIWLGLSHGVVSQRGYPQLRDFWQMVARSAFTELNYSAFRLFLCSATMLLMFAVPVLGLVAGAAPSALGALGLMAACYLPMVRFYRLPPQWALTLPVAAGLFLAMTWASAQAYWRGTRALWKNRVYGVVE